MYLYTSTRRVGPLFGETNSLGDDSFKAFHGDMIGSVQALTVPLLNLPPSFTAMTLVNLTATNPQ
jgi:hypothetical protein